MDSPSYCRVAVIAPRTRVDLALPVDVPIVDLLPLLLDYTGVRHEDGANRSGGWRLSRVGQPEFESGRTLRSLDVYDGEALHLTPRETGVAPPVFDDVVDAIAATVRTRLNTGSLNPGLGAAATAAALAGGALALFYRDHSTISAYVGGAVVIGLLGIALAVAKGTGDRIVSTVVAASALPYALIVGLSAVPGDYGRSGVMLGSAIAVAVSLAAVAAIGTGVVVFTAATVIGVLSALGALVATLSHQPPDRVLAGVLVVALASLATLPRLAIRLARLPVALVPTTSEELKATDDTDDIEEVTARARVANEYLNGTYIGAAIAVGFCALVLATHRTPMALALAGLGVFCMMMRTRRVPSFVARMALMISGIAAAVVAGTAVTLAHVGSYSWLLVASALVLAVFAVLLTVVRPRVRVSPSTERLVDLLESGALVAVLPVAVGVMDLYSTLRHL